MPAAVRGRIELSFLEMVVVLLLIAVLIAVAINRLWTLPAIAEHVAMDQVLGGLRSALGIKVAEDVANDRIQAIAGLSGRNPMDLLAQVPGNYVGVRAGPGQVLPGQWYYNRQDHYLVYRVRSTDAFVSALGGPARARFAIRVLYGQDHGRREIGGVRLQPVEPYRWRR
ncbi:MAG TPA: hypothetical protein VFN52_06390 [Acidiferrobacteraceae bacterium]|nr:hypothetical protein [Acidiferrobacteraceae bacterium]